jgi:hypothetical protein
MHLYRTIRNLMAISAGVAVLSLMTVGNAVPAALVWIVYVAWLPIRDGWKGAARQASWRRARTPDPRAGTAGASRRTGRLW